MDIGEALGTGAAMGSLLRTRSGAFCVDAALKLAQIKQAAEDGRLNDIVLPVEDVLPYPRAYVKAEGYTMARNGNPLPISIVDIPSDDSGLAHMPTPRDANVINMPSTDGNKVWLHDTDGLIGLFSVNDSTKKLRAEVML